jgi:Domain of unknown function (DUF5615)
MRSDPVKMRLLIDQNVAQDVVDFLIGRGHEVQLSRDVFQPNSPDRLLAIGAALEGLVIVSHDRDFRRFSDLFPQGFRTRARTLTGRIVIGVDPPKALGRIEAMIDLIETQHAFALSRRHRFMVTITNSGLNFIDNAPMP